MSHVFEGRKCWGRLTERAVYSYWKCRGKEYRHMSRVGQLTKQEQQRSKAPHAFLKCMTLPKRRLTRSWKRNTSYAKTKLDSDGRLRETFAVYTAHLGSFVQRGLCCGTTSPRSSCTNWQLHLAVSLTAKRAKGFSTWWLKVLYGLQKLIYD